MDVKLSYTTFNNSGFPMHETELGSPDSVDLQGALVSNGKDPVEDQDLMTLASYEAAQMPGVVEEQMTADASGVSGSAAVYISGNDIVSQCDASTEWKCGAIGVAVAPAAAGAPVTIRKVGKLTGCLSGAPAGTPYYVSSLGLPVIYSQLNIGDEIIQIGIARNPTDLEIQVRRFGAKVQL